jgi:hypothetical protein
LKSFARLGAFVLIIIGILAYLKTGVGLFEQVKVSGLKLQMGRFDQSLLLHYQSRRRFPTDITAFARRSFGDQQKADPAKDPWGELFRFEVQKKGYSLASSGPDQTWATPDDVVMSRVGGALSFSSDASGLQKQQKGIDHRVHDGRDPILLQLEQAMLELAAQDTQLDEESLNAWVETVLEGSWTE